ncbi:MAG: hypothetical protein ACJAXJ_004510 [Colwellia sp.]
MKIKIKMEMEINIKDAAFLATQVVIVTTMIINNR